MILITGGTGRIGKHLAERLLEKGEDVRILAQTGGFTPDFYTAAKTGSSKGGIKSPNGSTIEQLERKGAEIFFGDLLEKKSLDMALQGIETAYHLAAVVDYLAPKKLMWKVNVEGTINLMEACKKAGVKKIVYLSSTAVYGKKHENPATEKTPCKPSNFYGKTKMEAEKVVLEAGGIVLRSADVYFPGFAEGYHAIFSMLEKGKMRIIGYGKNRIQYIYIDDLIDALILARDNGKGGEVYNIAGNDILIQEDLYNMVCRFLGVEPPKNHIWVAVIKFLLAVINILDRIKGKKPKLIPEYIDKIAADRTFSIEKAKQIGFSPKVGYEEGLKQTVEYYKEHRNS